MDEGDASLPLLGDSTAPHPSREGEGHREAAGWGGGAEGRDSGDHPTPRRFAARPSPSRGGRRPLLAATPGRLLVGFALLGLLLRFLAARGDLWFDEVTSLRFLREQATSLGDVFLTIHSDNNHLFNSAWLWLVGLDAPVLMLRALSILLGGASVAAAWAACRPSGEISARVAALLFAVGYFFVHYGSEARGYSGMILAILVAYAALQAILARGVSAGRLGLFGAAICAGTLFHLTMLEASGALVASAMGPICFGPGGRREKFRRVALLAGAAGLASAPALGFFAHAVLAGDFRHGWMEPFTPATLFEGLAGVARSVLGLPESFGDASCVALAALMALALLAVVPARRRWFPAIAIFGSPLLHAALGLPSESYARFHMSVAVALPLLFADGFGALWARGRAWRGLGVAALALVLAGQALNLAKFFGAGRGDYTAAERRMTERGPTSFATDTEFAPGENRLLALFAARRAGFDLRPVAEGAWCGAPPQWLIVAALPKRPHPASLEKTAGPPDCPTRFRLDRAYPTWGLSGYSWTLYRRED